VGGGGRCLGEGDIRAKWVLSLIVENREIGSGGGEFLAKKRHRQGGKTCSPNRVHRHPRRGTEPINPQIVKGGEKRGKERNGIFSRKTGSQKKTI